MNILFTEAGWGDFTYWIKKDKRMINKLVKVLDAISRDPYEGIGKPERLKHELAGCWSRRINQEHRIVYQIDEELGNCIIISCRYHY